MKRVVKLTLSALLTAMLLLSVALGAAAWWLSGDGLRTRVEAVASKRLGVKVTMGKLSLSALPWPAVVVSDVALATTPPIRAQQISVRPVWGKLLAAPRELDITQLSLQGVNLPQRGLDQLSQLLSKSEHSAQVIQGQMAQKALKKELEAKPAPTPALSIGLLAMAQHVQLDQVTWVSKAGEALAISGDVRMSAARDAADVDVKLAGGSVRGALRLARTSADAKAAWQLRGELKTQGIDLAALPGLKARISGRLQATTTLDVQAAQLGALGAALQTRTQFNVSGAVIQGVDLLKAVRTLGLSREATRGGQTPLEQLSGNLTTRGAGAPMQLALTDLQAQSKLLKASGAVNVGAASGPGAPRALNGKLNVDLLAGGGVVGQAVGELVGIPLEISGTTASPIVMPTKGAMIGGAIGSVIAPVIGTGAGAKMGDKAATKLQGWKDKLFGK